MKDFREALQTAFSQKRGAGEPAWLPPLREQAYRRFQELDFPTRRTELWKYLNLNPVVKTPFVAADKNVAEIFSSEKVLSLKEALSLNQKQIEPLLKKRLENEGNPFAAINTFSFDNGFFIHVPAGVKLAKPIEIRCGGLENGASPRAAHPRFVILLEEGAEASLIFDQSGKTPGKNFVNSVADISLGKNAQLKFLLLQREAAETIRFFDARVAQKEKSRFEALIFSRGGGLIRNGFDIELEGEEAHASLHGLALLSGYSQVSNQIQIEHRVPRCTSRQIFKNVLDDKTLAEFTSLVHMWKGAVGSDSDQLDKNLLLSDDAMVYSRPQLKIDVDDVKATHGAATGEMAGDELFYLRSRGLDDKTARSVLTFGFAEEIIDEIPFPEVRESLGQWVRSELQKMLGEVR